MKIIIIKMLTEKYKRLLAIDQSFSCSGIAIYFPEQDLKLFKIEPKKLFDYEENIFLRELKKILYIKETLFSYIKEYNIDLVILEGYSFGSRGQALFNLAELGGYLKLSLYTEKIPFIIITPSQHKKFTTGKGNAKKEEVMMNVFKKYNIESTNNNITDAVSLLKTTITFLKYNDNLIKNSDLTKYELEVIRSINLKQCFIGENYEN